MMSRNSVVAFEYFLSSPELDGSKGANRATDAPQLLKADDDISAIKAWLAAYVESPNTFASYRKEAERLLLWSNLELGKALSSLVHEDMLRYQHFLKDPQPAHRWVLGQSRKVSRAHPDWRPFVGPLSDSSRRQALTILHGMFAWLVSAGYLAGNPLALSRQRTQHAQARMVRYLNEDDWSEVKQSIEQLPQDTPRQRDHYLRYRWVFTLLYLTGLRVSEVSLNTMGSFFSRRDHDGKVRWWMDINGKGGRTRTVPATSELMSELGNYRTFKGLSRYPLANESTPLVLPIGKQLKALTRAALHLIVKEIFLLTAQRIRAKGAKYEAEAQHIEQASAHWLRHTAGSHMLGNKVDLLHVRDTLGHGSISTTNRYLHSADDQRHDATQEVHKMKW